MPITTCVFDAYGTLFDVAAAARQAAAEPEFPHLQDSWAELANHWRLKQLQYSWLRAITDAHCGFWQVTQDGLDWALEATGLAGDHKLRKRLLDLYWQLQAYPEVPAMLAALKAAGRDNAVLATRAARHLGGGAPPALQLQLSITALQLQPLDILYCP